MHPDLLRKLLDSIAAGTTGVDDALSRLRDLPFETLEHAHLDHHRALRCGFPEVIFGQGKTAKQIDELFARLADVGGNVLATRVPRKAADRVLSRFSEAEYHRRCRLLTLRQKPAQWSQTHIGIIAAGTSDLPVAEEARVTAELMDQRTDLICDVGVAGLHRLLAQIDRIRAASVLIVVAGMEGALPSVVGGLVDIPIVAVPTSVGYGASLGGVAALLAMLNSCAAGVTVCNIDNGFGAAIHAARINRIADRAGKAGANGHIATDIHADSPQVIDPIAAR